MNYGKLFKAEKSVHTGMLTRCYNPNNSNYSYYGGRGITVCERWRGKGGFPRFLEDVGKKPSTDYTLDRIDHNGNYEPSNVRWADKKLQATNKSSTVFVTMDGKTLNLTEWSKITGIKVGTASKRILKGWNPIDAITKPVANKAKSISETGIRNWKKRSAEENTWYGIQSRCYCKSEPGYKDYGARGIKVCERWRGENGFDNFLADMGPKPSSEYSLERIDVYGDYEPNNCKWATNYEQGRNTRKTRLITIDGETKCLLDWSKISGIPVKTISNRIRLYNWEPKEAVFTPSIKVKV